MLYIDETFSAECSCHNQIIGLSVCLTGVQVLIRMVLSGLEKLCTSKHSRWLSGLYNRCWKEGRSVNNVQSEVRELGITDLMGSNRERAMKWCDAELLSLSHDQSLKTGRSVHFPAEEEMSSNQWIDGNHRHKPKRGAFLFDWLSGSTLTVMLMFHTNRYLDKCSAEWLDLVNWAPVGFTHVDKTSFPTPVTRGFVNTVSIQGGQWTQLSWSPFTVDREKLAPTANRAVGVDKCLTCGKSHQREGKKDSVIESAALSEWKRIRDLGQFVYFCFSKHTSAFVLTC